MNVIGLYLDFPYIRICSLTLKRKNAEIRALTTLPAAEMANVKPLYMKDFNGKLGSGVCSKNVLIRSMEMNIKRHVEEAIAFQAEAMNSLKPDEILTVPLLKKKEGGITEALLCSVSREGLKSHLAELGKYGIDPDFVSAAPLALSRFVNWKFPKLQNGFIIDLGSVETTCILVVNQELKKSHAIEIGVEALLEAFFEDRKKILLKKEIESAAQELDLLIFRPHVHPHLAHLLAKMRQEISRVFYSFSREERVEILFTGRTDCFKHLPQSLIEHEENKWPLALDERKFAMSIGFALEQSFLSPLQFRREEFFPPKNWRRLGRFALTLFSASLFLSTALIGWGLKTSASRKIEMAISLNLSPKGDLDEEIDRWILTIDKNNKEYPYILQSPKVTEWFHWLSSHPLLGELKKEGDPIQIHELRYQLISFPRVDLPKDPYQTKVEIEFDFLSPTNARKFHEALRNEREFIDTQSEINWEVLSKGYRASFFLKNRSPYVP